MKDPLSEERQNSGTALPAAARRSRALTLTTLGAASLSRGPRRSPETVVFGPGKPLALLAYLHCAPNRTASRDRLVDLLWSEGTLEARQHNLRQTVWYIRQRLGDKRITAQHGTVTFLADVTCDRSAFLAAVEGGNLERGVELYGGDFLPGGAGAGASGFEEWAGLERYRLRQLFTHAAEPVVRARLVAVRFDEAQQLARRVRDADPEDETGWRLWLETLLVGNDGTVAASEADVLEWQLAVRGREPAPATRALVRRVRRLAEQGNASPPGISTPRLVGREEQLGTLLGAWDAAARGRGCHADIVSAAGFGKTRLLKETQHRLAALGAPSVYVAASPAARDVPHLFASEIAGALAALPGSVGVSTATAATLVALNPSLSSRFPVAGDIAVGDEASRRRLLALIELMQVVSDEQAFTLLLDDFHWADRGSREIVQGLLERVHRFRALIVTAARPTTWARGVTSKSRVLHLPPLPLAAVRALVTDLGPLPRVPWAEALAVQLHSAAAGSPLILLDVLQGALDRGTLTLGSGGWTCENPSTLAAELETLRAGRVQPIESHPRSLLVVPFVAAPHGALDRLSDALSEDLIALLSGMSALRVISWPTARQLRATDRDLASLAAEVNARYVLHGSVRATDDGLHITAQLTDEIDGIPAWGESCRATLEDVQGVGERFARAVADALLLTLSSREDERIRRRVALHPRAHECYMRAREVLSSGLTVERLPRLLSLLRTALKVGGENALIYSTLGTAYSQYGMLTLENKGTLRRSEVCARKALALDPESADARFLTGLVRCRQGNIKQGVREMLTALAIDPHHTDALYWCSGWLGSLGKVETARPLAQRLLETDPLTATNLCIPGWIEWLGGRFEPALTWYRRWRDLEPGHPMALYIGAVALIWSQRFDEALELLERLDSVAPSSPLALYRPFLAHVFSGTKQDALAALTPELVAGAMCSEHTCWQMAAFHAMLDMPDEALEWLERAVKMGFINYPMLAEHDPFLKRLRGQVRFTRLLDGVKREWEALEF